MNKKIILAIISNVATLFMVGQIKTPINFDDCKMKDETFVNIEQGPVWKSSSITMNQYFQDVLTHSEPMKKLSGKVILGIFVDLNGDVCLNSFLDYDNNGFEAAPFQDAVKKMPKWEPAKFNGQPVHCNKAVILKIKKGKLTN